MSIASQQEARKQIVAIWREVTGEGQDCDLAGFDREWAFWEALLAAKAVSQ